jgi:hypothetical protein
VNIPQLWDSEINATVSRFHDDAFYVKIGGEMNDSWPKDAAAGGPKSRKGWQLWRGTTAPPATSVMFPA